MIDAGGEQHVSVGLERLAPRAEVERHPFAGHVPALRRVFQNYDLVEQGPVILIDQRAGGAVHYDSEVRI